MNNEMHFHARVACVHRSHYELWDNKGSIWKAKIKGGLRFQAASPLDFPVVGDWVEFQPTSVDEAIITAIGERSTLLTRRAPGPVVELQPIVANVDVIFILMSANRDFNLRRVERFLVIARQSGAEPVVVLSKIDLSTEWPVYEQQIRDRDSSIKLICASSMTGDGVEAVRELLPEGVTGVFIGSSGVGKSTLVNRLLGEDVMTTHEAREDDDRGRHTTTHREMLNIPSGGVIIDTPGVREIQLGDGEEGLEQEFYDITALSADCRFRDCNHETEPGCAVKKALEEGVLSEDRWQNYLKILRELAYFERKHNKAKQSEERKKWARIHREVRAKMKFEPK